MRYPLLGSILVAFLIARPASAQVKVSGLRVGYGGAAGEKEGSYKIGNWTPAAVTVKAGGAFDGRVEISTADNDDVQTTFERSVSIPTGSSSADVLTYVKPGKVQPTFHVRLLGSDGRTLDRETFESASGQVATGAPQRVALIVAVGRPAGLDVDEVIKRPGCLRDDLRIAHVKSLHDLPDRWFGYESVNHLVVCITKEADLKWWNDKMWNDAASDAAEKSAARARWDAVTTWVRQGGHLVVSVRSDWAVAAERHAGQVDLSDSNEWKAVTEQFGRMLPADVDRAETLAQLSELENYVSQNTPRIQLAKPLRVPHFIPERGRILAGVRDMPLVVRGPFGLGTVTLLALDVSADSMTAQPFQGWEGRTDFWVKLLRLAKQRTAERAGQGAWSQRAASDLGSHLHVDLERFGGVTLVPFHLVAALVFAYVLVVGPIDYWLVKRLKHMEFTWITLPVSVAGACLVAYLATNWLKSNSLAINKLDVIDVDVATGTLRGTNWFTLFSPTMKNYSVAVHPEPRWAAKTPEWNASPPMTVSWVGVAEDSIGGIGRRGGLRLFGPGYRYGADAANLRDVPVPVRSTKGFTARWLGTAGATLQTDLKSAGADRVRGPITNYTGENLTDCVLAFGSRMYRLGNVPARGSVNPDSTTPEDLRGHIARRAEAYERLRSTTNDPTADPQSLSSYDLLMTMMFRKRLGEENQIPANDYFDEIDLSEQLDNQRAIFVGRVTAPGSQVVLDGAPVTERVSGATVIRVILPVAAAAAPPPEERRDPRGF